MICFGAIKKLCCKDRKTMDFTKSNTIFFGDVKKMY